LWYNWDQIIMETNSYFLFLFVFVNINLMANFYWYIIELYDSPISVTYY
jgi:hypothetical protein